MVRDVRSCNCECCKRDIDTLAATQAETWLAAGSQRMNETDEVCSKVEWQDRSHGARFDA